MKVFFIIFATLIIIYFSFTSCEPPITDNKSIIFPDSNVSFIHHIQPFMRVTCSYQGCHSNESRAGGRAMVDYSSMLFDVANLGLVVPKDPDRSILCMMLEYKLPHTGFIYWTSTENQRKGIRKWISEGAEDN